MTLRHALKEARRVLTAAGTPDAALEGELLLRHLTGKDRVRLYLDLDTEFGGETEEAYRRLIERRLAGEPSAYITGTREFYGLDFSVDNRVLIPRPESELLVDEAVRRAGGIAAPVIADIGTGSGAIAISLAVALPRAVIYASDISTAALEVAAANCRRHGVAARVHLLAGDLLGPLPQPVDIIVANLPYVGRAEAGGNRFEPGLALNGGADGLDAIVLLCRQAVGMRPGGVLLLEIGQWQGGIVARLVNRVFPSSVVEITPDLAGIPRMVSVSTAVSFPAASG